MSLPRYPAYKDSCVKWLGEVPEHWNVQPCRAVVYERNERNDGLKNTDYLSLMANIGVMPYAEKGDVGNKMPEDLSKCKLVYNGDLVVNSMNYGIGSFGLSKYSGVCSPVYIVMQPITEIIEPRFVYRVFEIKKFQTYAQSFGNGILEHRAAINWDILKIIGIGLPPLVEQKIILNFLDRETAKIDDLIAEQEKLITLLGEKRQAMISHAVTKGLNPATPMKDSGIEWLGEVPEHWDVTSIRYIGVSQNGINIGAEFFGSGFPFVSYGDVYRNRELPLTVNGLVNSSENDRKLYSVEAGDVFFTRTSETVEEIGFSSVCVSTIVNATFAGFLIRLRPNRKLITPQFSKFYFSNQMLRLFFVKEMNLVTRASLSQGLLKKMSVLLPSQLEQNEIANYLNNQEAIFLSLTADSKQAISLLKERRSALISAAVTGKIDVRGLVNTEAA